MIFKDFNEIIDYVGEEKFEEIFENSEEEELLALLDIVGKLGECEGRMSAVIDIYPQKEVLDELEKARMEYYKAIITFFQRKGVKFD